MEDEGNKFTSSVRMTLSSPDSNDQRNGATCGDITWDDAEEVTRPHVGELIQKFSSRSTASPGSVSRPSFEYNVHAKRQSIDILSLMETEIEPRKPSQQRLEVEKATPVDTEPKVASYQLYLRPAEQNGQGGNHMTNMTVVEQDEENEEQAEAVGQITTYQLILGNEKENNNGWTDNVNESSMPAIKCIEEDPSITVDGEASGRDLLDLGSEKLIELDWIGLESREDTNDNREQNINEGDLLGLGYVNNEYSSQLNQLVDLDCQERILTMTTTELKNSSNNVLIDIDSSDSDKMDMTVDNSSAKTESDDLVELIKLPTDTHSKSQGDVRMLAPQETNISIDTDSISHGVDEGNVGKTDILIELPGDYDEIVFEDKINIDQNQEQEIHNDNSAIVDLLVDDTDDSDVLNWNINSEGAQRMISNADLDENELNLKDDHVSKEDEDRTHHSNIHDVDDPNDGDLVDNEIECLEHENSDTAELVSTGKSLYEEMMAAENETVDANSANGHSETNLEEEIEIIEDCDQVYQTDSEKYEILDRVDSIDFEEREVQNTNEKEINAMAVDNLDDFNDNIDDGTHHTDPTSDADVVLEESDIESDNHGCLGDERGDTVRTIITDPTTSSDVLGEQNDDERGNPSNMHGEEEQQIVDDNNIDRIVYANRADENYEIAKPTEDSLEVDAAEDNDNVRQVNSIKADDTIRLHSRNSFYYRNTWIDIRNVKSVNGKPVHFHPQMECEVTWLPW